MKIIIALSILLLIIVAVIGYQLYRANVVWAAWAAELETRNSELSESNYYRGVLSSCVGIAMQMDLSREMVATICDRYWLAAYQNDWYTELSIDSWQWPPEKKSAAP